MRINQYKFLDPVGKKKAYIGECVHINFVASLYQEQISQGRYFLHEHPEWATSWELPSIQALLKLPNVDRVRGDQCQFGAIAKSGRYAGLPVRKASGFMSNSPYILKKLDMKC